MKVMLLAGGFGTRLSEETDIRPKPLVEIGGYPILWHIMKIYAAAGLDDFVICAGYKSEMMKKFFIDFPLLGADIQVNLRTGEMKRLETDQLDDWKVTVADTGLHTMTGGRIKKALKYIDNEPFCLTYGDGVADIDIAEVVKFHKSHGKLVTVTSVPSPGRFGILEMDGNNVQRFLEKPNNEMGWINAGFFVCDPSVGDYIDGDSISFEKEPLERLAAEGELVAYKHEGFWRPMDTLRDKRELEDMWQNGIAPWKR